MHLTQGQMRAYHDGEFDEASFDEVRQHLEKCNRCRMESDEILARSTFAREAFSTLAGQPAAEPTPANLARARLQRQIDTKKERFPMLRNFFRNLSRPAWVGLTILVLLAVSLAFPQVRAFADDFLALFRVEQVTFVTVDSDALPNIMNQSARFETLFTETVEYEEFGEPGPAGSVEEAQARLGFPVRLPAELQGEPSFFVEPGVSATYVVDLDMVHTLLDEIGREDLRLPAELDGKRVSVEVNPMLMTMYGNCDSNDGYDPDMPNSGSRSNCTVIGQMQSPVISGPSNLDLTAIGEVYLQVLGMEPEEAHSFAQTVNWASTFVVPLPIQEADYYREINVDGAQGTVIGHRSGSKTEYMAFWVKDGVLYFLGGPGTYQTATRIGNSLQ